MKRLLTITVLLIASMSLFAVPGSFDAENNTPKELGQVPVTFDLAASTNYYIGFTSDVTNVAAGKDASQITDATEITLELDNTQTYGELAEKLYVYWVISGGQKLKIELEADAAMDDDGENKINWETSWAAYTNSSKGDTQTLGGTTAYSAESELNTYATEKMVFDRSAVSSTVERGYTEVTIKTQDITNAAAVEYTGHLQLVVTPL